MIERSRFSDEEGISLVEVLVAIMLLGLIMGALAQSLTSTLFSVQGQEKNVHATALAAELAEHAVSLPWSSVALCEGPATAYFGGATYTYPASDPESLVLLDDDDTVCSPGPAPLVPSQTLERSATDYQVETVVTWHDDVQDNTGLGGTDVNSPQDLKRIRVTVTWDARGDARTYSAETFVAPEGGEVGLRTRVEHANGLGYTYIKDDTNLTDSEVYLRLTAVTPQSAVRVQWTVLADDGTPSTVTQAMSNPSGDRVNWQYKIEEGSPDLAINKVPNAEIIFTFVATDALSGEETTVLDRGLFLIEPIGYGITAVQAPDTVRVTPDGAVCPFAIRVEVRGALSSDPVTIEWTSQPGLTSLPVTDSSSTGAVFEETFFGAMGFVPGMTESYTIRSERPADSQSDLATGGFLVVEEVQGC